MTKTAIVTGGARGIGRGCALELAARGYDIALIDLLEPEMARTKGEIEAKGRKALILSTMSSAGTTRRPGVWPHFLGISWSSIWMAAALPPCRR